MADLNKLRQAIDHVDQQLLTLLNERAGLAQEVGHLKQAEGSAVFRPEREAEVIRRLQQSPELKLQPASVGRMEYFSSIVYRILFNWFI
ncbi:MAG: chorismate mutase, partial [Burkholderiaceae bacterium]